MYAERTQGPWLPQSRPREEGKPTDERDFYIESEWLDLDNQSYGKISLIQTYKGRRTTIGYSTIREDTSDITAAYERLYDRQLEKMAEHLVAEQNKQDFIRIAKEKGHM